MVVPVGEVVTVVPGGNVVVAPDGNVVVVSVLPDGEVACAVPPLAAAPAAEGPLFPPPGPAFPIAALGLPPLAEELPMAALGLPPLADELPMAALPLPALAVPGALPAAAPELL